MHDDSASPVFPNQEPTPTPEPTPAPPPDPLDQLQHALDELKAASDAVKAKAVDFEAAKKAEQDYTDALNAQEEKLQAAHAALDRAFGVPASGSDLPPGVPALPPATASGGPTADQTPGAILGASWRNRRQPAKSAAVDHYRSAPQAIGPAENANPSPPSHLSPPPAHSLGHG